MYVHFDSCPYHNHTKLPNDIEVEKVEMLKWKSHIITEEEEDEEKIICNQPTIHTPTQPTPIYPTFANCVFDPPLCIVPIVAS